MSEQQFYELDEFRLPEGWAVAPGCMVPKRGLGVVPCVDAIYVGQEKPGYVPGMVVTIAQPHLAE